MDWIGSPFANDGGGDHNGASKKGPMTNLPPLPNCSPGKEIRKRRTFELSQWNRNRGGSVPGS